MTQQQQEYRATPHLQEVSLRFGTLLFNFRPNELYMTQPPPCSKDQWTFPTEDKETLCGCVSSG